MKNKFVVMLLSLVLLLSPMGLNGCAKNGIVVNPPDYNAEAYVVKFKLYPDVITIVEMGVTGLMYFEKTQGNATFATQVFDACTKAKQVLNAGSFSQAVAEFMNVINKPQFAAGAKIAMDMLTSKLGNVVLTDFDKTVLNGMFDQIAAAATSMNIDAASYPKVQEQIVKYGLSGKGN